MDTQQQNERDHDILDLMLVVAKHKRFIIWTVLIVSVLSVAYALLAPQYWLSSTLLKPIKSNDSINLSGTMSNLLGSNFSLNSGDLSGQDFVTLLESRTLTEDVVRHFDLVHYMKIHQPDTLKAKEKAIKGFTKKMRRIEYDDDAGTVSIGIISKDRQLSADVANYYCDILNRYNLETRVTKGRLNREFLEKRVADTKANIDSLGLAMRDFMSENNTVLLDEQTKEIVSLYGELVTEKYKNEIELDYASKFADPTFPQVAQLREKVRIINEKIRDMESKQDILKPKYVIDLNHYSEIEYQYAHLTLDLDTQKTIYQYLYPEYEKSRIEELKDTPSLEVIDKAVPSGYRFKPKRALVCVTNFLLALVLSVFLSFVIEYFAHKRDRVRELRDRLLS